MQLDNAINWFEIPVSDFDRAKKFYETLFGYEMPVNQVGPAKMGFFLYDYKAGKIGGAIVHHPELLQPSNTGTLVYLNCQPDLQFILNKVTEGGGKILVEKTIISTEQSLGYWALVNDTEGNNVGLHSMG